MQTKSLNVDTGVKLNPQAYEHLIALLRNEKKQALQAGIMGLVVGVAITAIDIIFWGFAVALNYQALNDSGLVNSFILVILGVGILLILEGATNLIKYKRIEKEIEYFTVR